MKLEQNKDLGEILGTEFEFTNVEDWLTNLGGFAESMAIATEEMKDNNFESGVCSGIMDEFELEDWREKYSSEGNYYTGGEQMEKIYRMLKELNQKGYETPEEWVDFKNSLSQIWSNLPDFYKGVPDSRIDFKPVDYSLSEPFPLYSVLPSL